MKQPDPHLPENEKEFLRALQLSVPVFEAKDWEDWVFRAACSPDHESRVSTVCLHQIISIVRQALGEDQYHQLVVDVVAKARHPSLSQFYTPSLPQRQKDQSFFDNVATLVMSLDLTLFAEKNWNLFGARKVEATSFLLPAIQALENFRHPDILDFSHRLWLSHPNHQTASFYLLTFYASKEFAEQQNLKIDLSVIKKEKENNPEDSWTRGLPANFCAEDLDSYRFEWKVARPGLSNNYQSLNSSIPEKIIKHVCRFAPKNIMHLAQKRPDFFVFWEVGFLHFLNHISQKNKGVTDTKDVSWLAVSTLEQFDDLFPRLPDERKKIWIEAILPCPAMVSPTAKACWGKCVLEASLDDVNKNDLKKPGLKKM